MRRLLIATLCAGFVGCSSPSQRQGRSDTETSYEWSGKLVATLPARADVFAVMAAAQATLRNRGYAIVSNDGTQDAGEVVGREPESSAGFSLAPTAHVKAWVGGDGTDVSVQIKPIGSESESRAILGDILGLLGL